MFLVLCDVCKEKTNRDKPIGTVTRTYKMKGNARVLDSQEFSTQILDSRIATENQERLHICSDCFNTGLTAEQGKALPGS